MDILKLSALVNVRNYIATVRESSNIIRGESRKLAEQKLAIIDKILISEFIDFDLNSLNETYTPSAGSVNAKSDVKELATSEDDAALIAASVAAAKAKRKAARDAARIEPEKQEVVE